LQLFAMVVNGMSRHWRKIVGVVLFLACSLVQAQMPFQGNPPNEPGAIVKAMIARDLKSLGRYTGWQDIEYTPLFESYPPHNIRRVKGADGKVTEHEDIPTFGTCAQTMLVKSIKVKKVLGAPDPLSPVSQPKASPNEVLVILEAEVLALRLLSMDAIPESYRCSWLGLEVQNTKTGKRESYFDNVDDDKALLKMMKQFGEVKGDYVIVEPHRRHWEYAVAMRLPHTGKGLRRHYDRTAEIGYRIFIDAVEPRWLIQEPYPPEAWHISTATKHVKEIIEGVKISALSSCAFAISRATGVDVRKVSEDLENPACKASKSVQKQLEDIRQSKLELQIVRDIELGGKR
jgi:hypothetical protein